MTSPNQPPRPDRPGAMTAAMPAAGTRARGPKVLRIGILHGDTIVEERTLRRGEVVTVGGSERNHVVVLGAGVPARFELLQPAGDDYVLNFTDVMSGRVGQPGGVLDLDQLRQSGVARRAGNHWQLQLDAASRGKLVIAETTLLFQFVPALAVRPRPQLPVAVRAGFVRSIDWLFTAFIVATFMTMFGFVVYLENADWPVALGLATVPEEFALPIFQEPTPPPDVSEPPEPLPSDPAPEVPAEKPKSEPERQAKRPDSGRNDIAPAERAARIAEQASRAAEALVVGALGAGADSAIIDVLAGGEVPGSAQDILLLATGIDRATSQSGRLRERGGGAQGSGQQGLGALAARGGPSTTAGRNEGDDVVEAPLRGRAVLESGGDVAGSGDFDASIVVQKIKSQLGAIKACYERELKHNPLLAGKVAIEFTIEERGTVSGVRVTDNNTGSAVVGTCVANAVQRFRFSPGPQGGSVTFAYPFVFAPQG